MKKIILLRRLPLTLAAVFLSAPLLFAQQPPPAKNTITISTYYPAPFGAYDTMLLVPKKPGFIPKDPCKVGTLYVDSDGKLKYCQNNAGTPAWGMVDQVWTQDDRDNIYPVDTASDRNVNVGIGTSDPQATLEILGSLGPPGNPAPGHPVLRLKTVSYPDSSPDSIAFENDVAASLGFQQFGAGLMYDGGFRIQRILPDKYDFAITKDGYVGIGTVGPKGKLDIVFNQEITSGVPGPGPSALNIKTISTSPSSGAPDAITFENDVASSKGYDRFGITPTPEGSLYINRDQKADGSYLPDTYDLVITKDGHVGIGTVGPKGKLDIVFNQEITSGVPGPGPSALNIKTISTSPSSGAPDAITFENDVASSKGYDRFGITPTPEGSLYINRDQKADGSYLPDTHDLVITKNGHVGIGTVAAKAKLDILSDLGPTPTHPEGLPALNIKTISKGPGSPDGIAFENDVASSLGFQQFGVGYMYDGSFRIERILPDKYDLVITKDGYVGIGTVAAKAKLDILSDLGPTPTHPEGLPALNIKTISKGPGSPDGIAFENDVASSLGFQQFGVGYMYDGSFRIERILPDKYDLVITKDGYVGIGTVSPTAKLQVNGNIKAVLNDIDGGSPANMRYNSGTYEIGFDVAELFETSEEVEPGDVLCIGKGKQFRRCTQPSDPKVAGVVSAAPAILFEGNQLQLAPTPFIFQHGTKPPVALAGRVRCRATVEGGPIQAGDLLVSSSRPGFAMRADPAQLKPGVVLGKALEPLEEGEGQIAILVTLQ